MTSKMLSAGQAWYANVVLTVIALLLLYLSFGDASPYGRPIRVQVAGIAGDLTTAIPTKDIDSQDKRDSLMPVYIAGIASDIGASLPVKTVGSDEASRVVIAGYDLTSAFPVRMLNTPLSVRITQEHPLVVSVPRENPLSVKVVGGGTTQNVRIVGIQNPGGPLAIMGMGGGWDAIPVTIPMSEPLGVNVMNTVDVDVMNRVRIRN